MKKRGITIISLSIIIIVMLILLSVVSVSLNYSIANAKKMAFVKEIYNIQSLVTEYIEKEETLPSTKESITIDLTKLNSKYLNQFDGETILQNKVDLYVLDLLELDIKNTNYGDKNIGSTDEEKEKDVYAVSEKTGRVYYIAGFESDGEKYYTLTDELRQMIEKNQNITIGEKTITFTPSKIGWSNEGVSVDVFVPSEFTSQAITVDNANITYTSTSDSNGIYYMVNSAKIAEDYTITISYTKNGKTDSATYTAKIDTAAPVISKNADITNTETRVKGLEASDNKSGIKYFKYSEGVIEEKDVKEYMHAYGRNIKKGTLKFDAKSKYTLYAEDKAGNYRVMYINRLGELVESLPPPPTLAARNTWYKASVTRDTITTINIVDVADDTTVTNATESWPAAVDSNGDGEFDDRIMCYLNGTTLTIAGDGSGKIMANEDSERTFGYPIYSINKINHFCNLTAINGLEIFDTSQVTDMSTMFLGCSNLTELDVSGFNTENVTSMYAMFEETNSLKNLDVSNFDTSKVTSMTYMFFGCRSLTKLDLSTFDTSQVDDMRYMFSTCSSLTSLDVSNFSTSQVTNMSCMFSACSSLTELDLSNFNTNQVTNMDHMFYGCRSLTKLDLSSFDTSQVAGMRYMFSGCSSLMTLDVSNFSTNQVTDMMYMFDYCSALTKLDLSSFDTSNVKDMCSMFNYCSALTKLDLSSFDTSNVKDMNSMFNYCSALTKLDLSSFDTSNVKDMYSMFKNCYALTELDVSNFNTRNVENGKLERFASNCTLNKIILGENFGQLSNIPSAGSDTGLFYTSSTIDTTVYGANDVMKEYDWASDNRNVTFEEVSP